MSAVHHSTPGLDLPDCFHAQLWEFQHLETMKIVQPKSSPSPLPLVSYSFSAGSRSQTSRSKELDGTKTLRPEVRWDDVDSFWGGEFFGSASQVPKFLQTIILDHLGSFRWKARGRLDLLDAIFCQHCGCSTNAAQVEATVLLA